jgi:hypothetical protein
LDAIWMLLQLALTGREVPASIDHLIPSMPLECCFHLQARRAATRETPSRNVHPFRSCEVRLGASEAPVDIAIRDLAPLLSCCSRLKPSRA